MPFFVVTRLGLNSSIRLQCNDLLLLDLWAHAQSLSLENSMLVWLSPFLYSNGQSRRMIREFFIRLRMFGCVISLLSMVPSRTFDSSIDPPGIFSMQAYRLIYTILWPFSSVATVRMACNVRWHIRSDHCKTNLVPIGVLIREYFLVIVCVNWDRYTFDNLKCLFEHLIVCGDYYHGVDITFQLCKGLCQDLTSWLIQFTIIRGVDIASLLT